LLRDPREEKQAQCPPIDVNLYLSLEELARGASVKVKVTRSALQSDLKTTAPEDRVLTVTVAPGWRAGTKLTFPGAGDEAAGLKAGDVVLTVLEKPHPRFTRVKHDLVHTVTLSLLKALTGTVVEVEVLDGRVISVPVNEVVAPGYVQVVPGEGMPVSGKPDKKGNLQLHFNVVYPTSLSIAQKEKLALILPQ
jgi:DnaJ-class molecular chaperone